MIRGLARKLVIGTPFESAARWANTHFSPTRAIRYDRETIAVMKRVLRRDSNCIDVGCHRGTILKEMVKLAPDGVHYAFEPLPGFYRHLVNSYPFSAYPNINLYELALSDIAGETTFHHIPSYPDLSGFKPRRYDYRGVQPALRELTSSESNIKRLFERYITAPTSVSEQIEVKTNLLDNIVPSGFPVHFIKVDVEGAELQVLKGALETIRKNRPIIVFEHGLGGSDYYGTTPEEVYDLLVKDCGLYVSLMKRWLRNKEPLTRQEFTYQYYQHKNHYFMAYE